MIKNISENILNKYFPNLSKEHKKWVIIFNELYLRIGTVLESLVSFYSGQVFFMYMSLYSINQTNETIRIGMKN